MQPLISENQLKNAKKILYMTHLAIGDFVFQGAYLKALAAKYPHLQLDIWLDDCRSHSKGWHAGRNDVLCQWLESEPYIHKIYPITANRQRRKGLVKQAQQQGYDLIFFIATQRSELYAKYARQISAQAFIAGSRAKPYQRPISKHYYFSKLDAAFDVEKLKKASPAHISGIYQRRFERCIGRLFAQTDARRGLVLNVPDNFATQARQQRQAWTETLPTQPAQFVLLNHLSTTAKRDYNWLQVMELTHSLHQRYPSLAFVLNLPPHKVADIQRQLDAQPELHPLPVFTYSATEHFFQLPAMIQACDWVISVETAVMHLAAALNKPQIVLMRESALVWRPTRAEEVLLGRKRVDNIPVSEVLDACARMLARCKSDQIAPC